MTKHFEDVLKATIQNADIPATKLREAMLYTLFPGGKRLRPRLIYLTGALFSLPQQVLDAMALAIELIHTYSLVHDDLPAMDNDDMRRGKPSCHRAFDEATAILVGDALQPLAIDILLAELPKHLALPKVVAITHELTKACGASGMVSGQSLDLTELEQAVVTEDTLETVHDLKTSRMILACINMVLLAAAPPKEAAHALRLFAAHLGLAFQMQDDFLDAFGPTEGLGKNRASDSANNKSTFASCYSEKALANMVEIHFEKTEKYLSYFGDKADDLKTLLHGLLQRSQKVTI